MMAPRKKQDGRRRGTGETATPPDRARPSPREVIRGVLARCGEREPTKRVIARVRAALWRWGERNVSFRREVFWDYAEYMTYYLRTLDRNQRARMPIDGTAVTAQVTSQPDAVPVGTRLTSLAALEWWMRYTFRLVGGVALYAAGPADLLKQKERLLRQIEGERRHVALIEALLQRMAETGCQTAGELLGKDPDFLLRWQRDWMRAEDRAGAEPPASGSGDRTPQ
jgi:hypothetical protein